MTRSSFGRARINAALANDRACPASEDEDQPAVSGGIVIISTADTGGADPIGNVIRHNTLRGNGPADIVWDGTGSGNQVTHNNCHTAIPPNLGWC